MRNNIFLVALFASQIGGIDAKTFDDYNVLVQKIEDYSESTDIESFLELPHTILVTGYTMTWKRHRSFILIDKIEYREQTEAKGVIKHSYDIKAFAIVSELSQWPKEYSNKKITLKGILKKEERSDTGETVKSQDIDPSLFPYVPYSQYYFEGYTWELSE